MARRRAGPDGWEVGADCHFNAVVQRVTSDQGSSMARARGRKLSLAARFIVFIMDNQGRSWG